MCVLAQTLTVFLVGDEPEGDGNGKRIGGILKQSGGCSGTGRSVGGRGTRRRTCRSQRNSLARGSRGNSRAHDSWSGRGHVGPALWTDEGEVSRRRSVDRRGGTQGRRTTASAGVRERSGSQDRSRGARTWPSGRGRRERKFRHGWSYGWCVANLARRKDRSVSAA